MEAKGFLVSGEPAAAGSIVWKCENELLILYS